MGQTSGHEVIMGPGKPLRSADSLPIAERSGWGVWPLHLFNGYMTSTPETQEAIERWRQGKINVFDEMARLERERDFLRTHVRRLFELLETVEVSDSEREFHPTVIRSCRVMHTMELDKLLPKLKEAAK